VVPTLHMLYLQSADARLCSRSGVKRTRKYSGDVLGSPFDLLDLRVLKVLPYREIPIGHCRIQSIAPFFVINPVPSVRSIL
jgi:hypothetical protein